MANGDLLNPIVPANQLHPSFKLLIEQRGHEPHRGMLRALWAALPSPDGGFVREFQTEHFDRRIWELYVFALGHSGPFSVSRPHDSPDFLFEQRDVAIWVEATTANPSEIHPVKSGRKTPEALIVEMNEEIPIRLGSPLVLETAGAVTGTIACRGEATGACLRRLLTRRGCKAFRLRATSVSLRHGREGDIAARKDRPAGER